MMEGLLATLLLVGCCGQQLCLAAAQQSRGGENSGKLLSVYASAGDAAAETAGDRPTPAVSGSHERKGPPTLKLPTVFSSNMVLQQANGPTNAGAGAPRGGRRSSVWGWSNFTKAVSVSLDGELLGKATPDASRGGMWTFVLPAAAHAVPSSGHTIEISAGAGATRTLTNVAFGDVYLCSGQARHPPRTPHSHSQQRLEAGVGAS
jgi:hypothetical protein